MLTGLFDEAEARGEIRGQIKAYHKMDMLPSDIVKEIMAEYSLKKEEAEEHVENTLKMVSVSK